ncbi:hypothetical protein QF035_008890 [Streptomyces umbrinus]|uniref:Transmembrane protein n=1 Tax=Streptomyces umbrinus TaxID=67370 RepID=A0ABU0T677_9ACTN|nr:hypothetical protein [Streptomyces umbrinus]MDQ1031308.1 hypothetical protein [Streptomyces umbrinus]
MIFNWGGSVWELMLVQRPANTHLSQSSTLGGKSPLARGDDNTLVTHAVLFAGNKAVLGILGAGVVVGALVVTAAPHVKSGLLSLKSRLSRRVAETADVETPVPLTVVAEVEPEQPDAPRLRAV